MQLAGLPVARLDIIATTRLPDDDAFARADTIYELVRPIPLSSSL